MLTFPPDISKFPATAQAAKLMSDTANGKKIARPPADAILAQGRWFGLRSTLKKSEWPALGHSLDTPLSRLSRAYARASTCFGCAEEAISI